MFFRQSFYRGVIDSTALDKHTEGDQNKDCIKILVVINEYHQDAPCYNSHKDDGHKTKK